MTDPDILPFPQPADARRRAMQSIRHTAEAVFFTLTEVQQLTFAAWLEGYAADLLRRARGEPAPTPTDPPF